MSISSRRWLSAGVVLALGASLLAGCLSRKLAQLNPCLVSGVSAQISVTNIDKVDLLFVVDNSTSMQDKQRALRAQFPHVMRVLTTGDKDGDGVQDFAPPKDLHVAVVSSDMGLIGISDVQQCSGLGDDGLFQHTPHPGPDVQGCQAQYPSFLSFTAGVSDPQRTATDFACIAALGTSGCGLEQQLESGFKALWPSVDPMPPAPEKNRYNFLSMPDATGALSHGDRENQGFLRNDPVTGLSLIAIIVLTDEDDSSIRDPSIYKPTTGDPIAESLNLRPISKPDSLYPIDRYISGFKALRPGNENLVVFGAITGVPPDLADHSKVDWSNDAQRNAFYQTIMSDPRMTPMPDPQSGTSGGLLMPCCSSTVGHAVPGRRIIQTAQGFGANGDVYSICAEDYAPALDGIIAIIARQLGAVCLPRTLVRNSNGQVKCNVVWELPPATNPPPGAPTACGQTGWEFLMDPGPDEAHVTERGGARCTVAQLAVKNAPNSPDGKTFVPTMTNGTLFNRGWFYDDFSAAVRQNCSGDSKQRVTFTADASPPTGVTVKLECLNETQTLVNTRTDLAPAVAQPAIGDPCENVTRNGQTLSGDAACMHAAIGSIN